MDRVGSGRIAGAAACLLAAAALPAAALAAQPLKGTVYRGSLGGAQASVAIALRVSSAGEVSGLSLSKLPIYCPGSGPPGTPTIVLVPARVSAGGSFATTGKDVIGSGRLKGSVVARFKLSGTFAGGGAAGGALITSYGGAARGCGGRSSYTAHA
jgi:hypothetical protein